MVTSPSRALTRSTMLASPGRLASTTADAVVGDLHVQPVTPRCCTVTVALLRSERALPRLRAPRRRRNKAVASTAARPGSRARSRGPATEAARPPPPARRPGPSATARPGGSRAPGPAARQYLPEPVPGLGQVPVRLPVGRPGHRDREPGGQAQQVLLHAIMQVTFKAPSFRQPGLDDTRPGRADLLQLLPRGLRLELGVLQRQPARLDGGVEQPPVPGQGGIGDDDRDRGPLLRCG